MSRAKHALVLTSSLVFLGGLALFAYVGSFTRFWADDYCYSAVARQNGFWGGITEWYLHSGNRFSAIASVAVFDGLFGSSNVIFLPGLLLSLWVVSWIFLLDRLINRLLGWHVNRLWLALFGLMQVFFVVLLSPDRLQTVYWRMGMLHYAFPLPLLLIVLGLTAGNLHQHIRLWLVLVSAGIAFYAAGQSETYAMLQVGVLSLGLVAALVFYKDARRGRAAAWLGVPLLSSLAVIALMFLSPSLSDRLSVMPAPTNLWLIAPYTLRYVSDFIFYSIRGQVMPYAVYLLLVAAMSLAALHLNRSGSLSLRTAFLGMILSLLLTFVLIAFSFTPSAYANLQYPAGRALMPASFTLLVGMASLAFFLSALVLHLRLPFSRDTLQVGVLLFIVGLSLYALRAARLPLAEIQQQAVRAARWDSRDMQIRQAIAAGEVDIVTQQVEVVYTLEDLGPDPRHWINNCASVYYGVHSITANP